MDRKIFLSLGFHSMYEYALSIGLSEANSYTYTKIAKVSVTIPELKIEIEKGSVSITNARRIAPLLTSENKTELLEKAASLSSRSLEKVVAALSPESTRESVRVVSEDRLSLKLGISEALLQKLKRAQVLLSNQKRRNVSLEEVLEASVDQFLEREDPVLKAKRATEGKKEIKKEIKVVARPNGLQPRPSILRRKPIPAAIRHLVFQRDRGKCGFRRPDGTSCGSEHFVEIHHCIPLSRGGPHTIQNLVTLCSAHHRFHHDREAVG